MLLTFRDQSAFIPSLPVEEFYSTFLTSHQRARKKVTVYTKIHAQAQDPSIEIMQIALHNGLTVSTSKRTLAEILSLSYPEQLSSYSIISVKKLVWGKIRVNYSGRDLELSNAVSFSALFFFLSPYFCFNLGSTEKNWVAGGRGCIAQISLRLSRGSYALWRRYDSDVLGNVHPCVPRCVRTFAPFNYFAYIFVAFGTFVWSESADKTKAQLACHDITDCKSHLQVPRSTWMPNCVIVSHLFHLYSSKEHGVAVRIPSTQPFLIMLFLFLCLRGSLLVKGQNLPIFLSRKRFGRVHWLSGWQRLGTFTSTGPTLCVSSRNFTSYC